MALPPPDAPPPPLRPPVRVPPERFQLPVDRMREGYYSDKYFVRTRDVLAATGRNPQVTLQVFQKQPACLGGVDEAIAILKLCLTDGYRWDDLDVLALHDGDRCRAARDRDAHRGPYDAFAHLETLYLGVLARRTRVATNTRLVVEAAWPKPVMFFPGALRSLAGADRRRLCRAHRRRHRRLDRRAGVVVGLEGHRHGAARADCRVRRRYRRGDRRHSRITSAGEVQLISLVDFDNDCVGDLARRSRARSATRLYGVRLDTSETMVDRSVHAADGHFDPRGVNPQLVRNVRAALDAEGFPHVRITASGGFDRGEDPPLRTRRRCRWIPTASVRRCSPGDSTSPATSSWWRGSPLAKQGRGTAQPAARAS